jgi:hypothetical protein
VFTSSGGDALQHKEEIVALWENAYRSYALIATCVSVFLLIAIMYSLFRIYQIRTEENHAMHEAEHNYWHRLESHEESNFAPGFHKWQQVQEHVASHNPHEWRLAILEADIILDELVYERFSDLGETLGERLKRVDRADFRSIDKAWEAHRTRNAIAHEGSSFELSEREMRHILNLYEEVFREFHYI